MSAMKKARHAVCRGKPSKGEESKKEDFEEEKKQIEMILWYETRPEGP